MQKLSESHVFIAGLGGVGGYAAEMLCRAGVGTFTILDGDLVEPSNINRQLIALNSSLGKPKSELISARLKDINPDVKINSINKFAQNEDFHDILKEDFTYVIDAIDTLTPKIYLIKQTIDRGSPLISSMGAGSKTDPSKIQIADISKSYNCRLARMLRKRLRKLDIDKGFKVVFSHEKHMPDSIVEQESMNKKSVAGTISYLPAMFGCYCAAEVVRDIIEDKV